MTLLEVLVVLNLMGLTAFLALAIYASMLRTQVMARVMVQGQEVASRHLLEVLGRPCAWVNAFQPTISSIIDEGRTFDRDVLVSVLPGTDLWRIRVDVRWRVAGRPQQTSLLYHHAFYGLVCPQWLYPYRR